jgi:hypothetical protein
LERGGELWEKLFKYFGALGEMPKIVSQKLLIFQEV